MSTRSSSRISAHDINSRVSQSSMSLQAVVAAKPPVAEPESPSSPSSTSRSTPPKKRSRSDHKGPQQRTRKRKNCTDVEERRRQLEADPWTLEVRSRIVRCLGCKRWIKLDQRNEYYSGLWAKHRDLCRGVKMMKGEALPKRTRKSKKKPAVPAVANSASVTLPAAGTKATAATETAEAHPEILSAYTDSPTPSVTESSVLSLSPSPEIASRAPSETFTASDRTSSSQTPLSARPIYNPYPPPHPRAAPTPSSGYHWPQYVPYNYSAPYHLAYYPVAQPPTLKLPPISTVMRNRSPSPGLYENDFEDDNMDMDMDDDAERFAFAPAAPDDCHGHNCRPRFRYSTQHEIRTYFDGATLDSMAQRLTCPADDMTYRGAVCLLSLRRK